MKKYTIGFQKTFYFYKTVEAETKDLAVKKAKPIEEPTILNHGWRDYGHHMKVESIKEEPEDVNE